VLLSRNKKAAGSPEPRLGEKQKSRGLFGARGSHLVMVDPSQTQSSSPGAYYYDEYENKAAEQRPMDHVHSLSLFNGDDIFISGRKRCQGDFWRFFDPARLEVPAGKDAFGNPTYNADGY